MCSVEPVDCRLAILGFWLRLDHPSHMTRNHRGRSLQACACARSPWLRHSCTGDGGGSCHGRATFNEPGCRVYLPAALCQTICMQGMCSNSLPPHPSRGPQARITVRRGHVLARRAVRGSFGVAPSTSLARTCGTHGLLPIGRW